MCSTRCLYFLRDKSFISLLHADRPIVIIQRTLQVILDQLTACCMPVHLVTSDQLVNSGSEKLVTESLIEQLSNNVDNFRSILDCMMDLIKYKCKDEQAEIEVSIELLRFGGSWTSTIKCNCLPPCIVAICETGCC
jgi:hypothetical protein